MYCFKNALDNWVWAEYQNKPVANQQKRACLLMMQRRERMTDISWAERQKDRDGG